MKIAFVNKSTLVTDAQAAGIAQACINQINYHTAPAWGQTGVDGGFFAEKDVPAGYDKIVFFDNADQAGALGYHTEDPDGSVYGKIFAHDTMSHGAQVMGGPGSVCSVASHEALELWQDRNVNKWAVGPDGVLYAWEVGDPVENDSYELYRTYAGSKVTVSNFALPAWFDDTPAPGSRFDYMGRLTAPFTMTPGGYVVYATVGTPQQKFGALSQAFILKAGAMNLVAHFSEGYPEWKKAKKLVGAARSARRFLKQVL